MEQEKKKIYIAGPVTGLEYEQVCARFMEAEEKLAGRGYDPVNPIRLCSSSWAWGKCMRVCLKHLSECDGIYMLKGWKKSRGAKLEHFIALKLGMRVMVER